MDTEDTLVFNAQWWQSEASVMHEFVLTYFLKDNSIELLDKKTRKPFLRRTIVDSVCGKDLTIDSRIYVFGRKIHIVDYGNAETKDLISRKSQRALVVVPGQRKQSLPEVLKKISALNLNLINCFMNQISSDDLIRVGLLTDERIADIKYNLLNEPAVLLEISGKSIEKKIEDIPEHCSGVFVTTSEATIDFFFKGSAMKQKIARKEDKSSILCLIKPHIVHANQTGEVLESLTKEGFSISNVKLCHLDRSQSDEFLRVYEGVVPEFIQMSIHLASGALLALELSHHEEEDVHAKLRNFCGPYDSELAKKVRPHTIRGMFGLNKICNAVHCTDLKEDIGMELDFFFG